MVVEANLRVKISGGGAQEQYSSCNAVIDVTREIEQAYSNLWCLYGEKAKEPNIK